MAESKRYWPFMPVPEAYQKASRNLTLQRMIQSLSDLFGIPVGAISTKFKEHLRDVADKEYPNFRCSVARAVIEGRIPGVPSPKQIVQPQFRYQLDRMLFVLDLLETVACLALEDDLKNLDVKQRSHVRELQQAMGTSKLPVEALSSTKETLDAKQVSEAGEVHAGSGSQPGVRQGGGDPPKGRKGVRQGRPNRRR